MIKKVSENKNIDVMKRTGQYAFHYKDTVTWQKRSVKR